MTRIYGHILCSKCGEPYGSFIYNGGPARVKNGLCISCKALSIEEDDNNDEKRKS